jgi:hypothetical protein
MEMQMHKYNQTRNICGQKESMDIQQVWYDLADKVINVADTWLPLAEVIYTAVTQETEFSHYNHSKQRMIVQSQHLLVERLMGYLEPISALRSRNQLIVDNDLGCLDLG